MVALGLSLGVMPVTLAAQAAPERTQAQLDSLRQRVEDAEAALQALREQLATEASSALRTRSRVSLEFTGRALMHVVKNDARTNNVDVPVFARPDSGTGPQGGLAMTIRQTTLGLGFAVSEVAGGTFRGDLDADFFGGQQPSSGGRTFPLVRLRTARGTLEWAKGFVMIGQEQPLITGVDPVSLASVGVPGFTAAGNLWLWLPQVRAGVHSAGRVRVGVEGAVLAPTSGDAAGLFDTQFDAAERTGTPYLQGLVRMAWGEAERPGSITVGMHTGTIADATDAERTSEAMAATATTADRLAARGARRVLRRAGAARTRWRRRRARDSASAVRRCARAAAGVRSISRRRRASSSVAAWASTTPRMRTSRRVAGSRTRRPRRTCIGGRPARSCSASSGGGSRPTSLSARAPRST
jgi:hypothetical protein